LNPSAEATRSGKRVAIIQSNYIPWKGYFDIINMVDEFILYDDRQYTRRDWRNRNMIKTPQGLHWLTIPVQVKGKFEQRIDETVIDDPTWADRHWKTIAQAYAGAPYFAFYREKIGAIFDSIHETRLSDVNRRFLEALCGLLGIDTPLRWSTEYPATGNRTERLVSLCRLAGATEYLSGPAARAYMEENLFEEAGIALRYMDYTGYPEYPQLHGKFEHGVSVIDLLFNVGPEAPRYMKSFGAAVAAG
jgi:hypothetical protein